MLKHSIPFTKEELANSLALLPSQQAVFALYGAEPESTPYIGRTPNLKRRLERILRPAEDNSRRLNLTSRITKIAWTAVGSDLEALLLMYSLYRESYGDKAAEKMKLKPPAFLKLTAGSSWPRLTVTTKATKKDLPFTFGPFASRVEAEKVCEAVEDLFLLRRCTIHIEPDPSHPGCIYSEMKKCLAPCYAGCTPERYDLEAKDVEHFLASRGESLKQLYEQNREQASADLEFEAAAAWHEKATHIRDVQALFMDLPRRLTELNGVIVETSNTQGFVSLFQLRAGQLTGPVQYSTAGMRIANENSGSSSLYAHPTMLEAIPLSAQEAAVQVASKDELKERLRQSLDELEKQPMPGFESSALLAHLRLLLRWSSSSNHGEMIYLQPGQETPTRQILRGISKVCAIMLQQHPLKSDHLPV